MGYDLYGKNCIGHEELFKMSKEESSQWYETSSKTGQMFSCNVWYWKYIHLAVMTVGEIKNTEECINGWSMNNGYKVSEKCSKRIAKKIRELILDEKYFSLWITNKKIKEIYKENEIPEDYLNKVKKEIKELLEEFIVFCDKSNGFEIC